MSQRPLGTITAYDSIISLLDKETEMMRPLGEEHLLTLLHAHVSSRLATVRTAREKSECLRNTGSGT
jgi:hypothetical protein